MNDVAEIFAIHFRDRIGFEAFPLTQSSENFANCNRLSSQIFFSYFSARHERKKLVISFSASPREVGRNAECNESSMC